MNIAQYFIEAFESLVGNKMRSGLTVLGIVIGVAAVISMLAIGQGTTASITNSINSMGTNLLFITSGNRSSTVKITFPEPLTLADVKALSDPEQAPDIAAVTGVIQTSGYVSYSGSSATTSILGVSADYPSIRNLTTSAGDFFTTQDITDRSAVAVIGSDVVDNLFSDSSNVVGQTIRVAGQPFKVVGVLTSKGGSISSQDNQILVPLTTAESRLTRRGTKNSVDQILVSAASSSQADAAKEEITAILRARHKLADGSPDDFTVMSQSDMLATASTITQTLTMFLGGVGGISLLVGGIGIMNIMLVSVTERTREIGLRKALGARKRDILAQFLMESSVLSLLGGIIGVILAWGICILVAKLTASSGTAINPVITVSSILLATLFSAGVGLFFGFYPANRASNLLPVEALRSE